MDAINAINIATVKSRNSLPGVAKEKIGYRNIELTSNEAERMV